MSYTPVKFQEYATTIGRQIAVVKSSNRLTPKVQGEFDIAIVKTLDQKVQEAERICADFNAKVDKCHKVAKDDLDAAMALLKSKGKKLTDGDLVFVETSLKTILRCQSEAEQLAVAIYAPLKEFREDFTPLFIPLVSNADLLKPFVPRRGKTIEDGKIRTALIERLGEYVSRMKEVVRVVEQTVSRGEAMAGQEIKAAEELKASVEDCVSVFKDQAERATKSLQQIAALDPRQKTPANLVSQRKAQLQNGQTAAKNARGKLKTLSVKIDLFKKLSATFVDESKKEALKQLTLAQQKLKEIESSEKALAKVEAAADKVWTAIGKLK